MSQAQNPPASGARGKQQVGMASNRYAYNPDTGILRRIPPGVKPDFVFDAETEPGGRIQADDDGLQRCDYCGLFFDRDEISETPEKYRDKSGKWQTAYHFACSGCKAIVKGDIE